MAASSWSAKRGGLSLILGGNTFPDTSILTCVQVYSRDDHSLLVSKPQCRLSASEIDDKSHLHDFRLRDLKSGGDIASSCRAGLSHLISGVA